MTQQHSESGNASNRRALAIAVPVSVAGAAFCWLVFDGYGWWWDGFWLAITGAYFGVNIGLYVQARLPKIRESDTPFIVCQIIGLGAMAAVWLYLPESAVESSGRVARAAFGALSGWLCADALHTLRYCPYADAQRDRKAA